MLTFQHLTFLDITKRAEADGSCSVVSSASTLLATLDALFLLQNLSFLTDESLFHGAAGFTPLKEKRIAELEAVVAVVSMEQRVLPR